MGDSLPVPPLSSFVLPPGRQQLQADFYHYCFLGKHQSGDCDGGGGDDGHDGDDDGHDGGDDGDNGGDGDDGGDVILNSD